MTQSKLVHRLIRRRAQRGNALFISVMVITLMTAVGMFSMRAASLAEKASGFNRQGVQTTYVSEFAGRAMMAEMVGKEQFYFNLVSGGADDCRANRELAAILDPERPPCYKLQSSEIWEHIHSAFPGATGSEGAPELFGRLTDSNTEAAFIVEMTDLSRAGGPIAGEDVAADNFKYMRMLVSATAQVRPAGNPADEDGTCNEAFASTSGLQTLRAQVTFGPIN
jgi:hypothetical protein